MVYPVFRDPGVEKQWAQLAVWAVGHRPGENCCESHNRWEPERGAEPSSD